MITTPRDYYNLYHRIQSENAPSLAILLPTDEKIYNVDLNSRVVEAPEYLGVERDHRAEVIYFKVNRLNIELYKDIKDVELEETVEAVLDKHGIFYEKSEVWIESENLYEVLYQMEV